MQLNGGLMIALGAGLALLVSIYNYFVSPALFAPTSDIAHTAGALVAILATLALFLAGLGLARRRPGAALTAFLVIGSLVGIAGTALAGVLLESRVLVVLMAVCALGWLIRIATSRRPA